MIVDHPIALQLTELGPNPGALAQWLATPRPEAEVRRYLADRPLAHAAAGHAQLALWTRSGALRFGVGPHVSLVPTSPAFERHAPAHAVDALSRFAVLRRQGLGFVLEHPLAFCRVEITSAKALPSVMAPDPREAPALVQLLAETGFFVCADSENRGPARQWEAHDLWFHARSRDFRHGRTLGATYRFGTTPTHPPLMRRAIHPTTNPSPADAFSTVLARRRSQRAHGPVPPSRAEFEELLTLTLAEREGRRSYPSGGGCYPLVAYLCVGQARDLPRDVYRFDPQSGELTGLGADPGELLARARLSGAEPHAVLVLAVRSAEVLGKYESIGYRLVVLEVGAVMQTLYLGCAALGLAGCAVGAGAPDALGRATDRAVLEEVSVGEFVIGAQVR